MSMPGMSNGTELWCPVKGGGCIPEVSINRGSTERTIIIKSQPLRFVLKGSTVHTVCMSFQTEECIYACTYIQ